MAKTVEEILKDITDAQVDMGDDDALEFLIQIKDGVETMIEDFPEEEEEETETVNGTGDEAVGEVSPVPPSTPADDATGEGGPAAA